MLDRLYVITIEVLVFVALAAMVGIGVRVDGAQVGAGLGRFVLVRGNHPLCMHMDGVPLLGPDDPLRHPLPSRPAASAGCRSAAAIGLSLFAVAVMVWFEAVLIWFGSLVTMQNMEQQSTSLEFPMGYVYIAIPIGGVLMLFETLQLGWTIWRRRQPVPAAEQPLVD